MNNQLFGPEYFGPYDETESTNLQNINSIRLLFFSKKNNKKWNPQICKILTVSAVFVIFERRKKSNLFMHSLILKLTKFSMQFEADPHHYKAHKIDNTCKYFTEMHKYE